MYREPGVSGQCHAVPDRTPTISQGQIRTSLKVQCVKFYHPSVGLQIALLVCSPLKLANELCGRRTTTRVLWTTSMFSFFIE